MAADTPPKPHHTGHRERLRERARAAGLPTLPDYELLELFLFRSQPQGDPTPSRADIEMTKQVVLAAKSLSVEVHDHLIVGRDGVASFKQLGLM